MEIYDITRNGAVSDIQSLPLELKTPANIMGLCTSKKATKASIRSIPFYDLTVRTEAIEEDVFPILKELRPEWERGNLLSEDFKKGCMNRMVCFYQTDDEHRSKAVVVRIYGADAGDLNQRDREFMNLQIAHAAGCFPTIYATFNNGLVYQYVVGRHTNFHDIVKPENARTISRLLYRLHHVDIDAMSLVDRKGKPVTYDKTPWLFDQTMDFISSIPEAPQDGEKIQKFTELRDELTDQVLKDEFEFLKSIVDEIDFPVGFGHMDMHPRNIIVNDATGDIAFVDLEMSCFSYPYTDLVSLFVCKNMFDAMGFTTPDEPSVNPDVRKLYLQSYFEAKQEAEGPSKSPDVEAEILDIEHSLLEIILLFQTLTMFFAMVDVNVEVNFLDLAPTFMKDYFAGKDKLVGLKDRYLELKAKL